MDTTMNSVPKQPRPRSATARFAWALMTMFVVESFVLGLAALPTVLFLQWHASWNLSPGWLGVVVMAMAALPAYVIFSFILMGLSAASTRLLDWRPPTHGELRISDMEPPLLDWGRYMISSYFVSTLVGPFLVATPVWNWYLRINGARIGSGVWVNSRGVTDHCNIDLGDDVVIGAGVHLSAHTVERGVLRIAPVRIGARSTIGVNSHVQIGVDIGDDCQVGSLSMVPKFATLRGPGTYVGVPVHPLERAGEKLGGTQS